MNQTQFVQRIKRLENIAAQQGHISQRRVVAWLALAYAYPAVIALLSIALPIVSVLGLVTRNPMIAASAMVAWFFVAAHVISVFQLFRDTNDYGKDERRAVTAQEAPKLYAAIEDVGKLAPHVKINGVYIDSAHNASARQVPRWGYLLGSRNEITLGLPLLQTMSRDQVVAVLAHEFAHLAGADGKLSTRVYALYQAWGKLHARLDSREKRGTFVHWLLNWYMPRFNAETQVLRRATEYTADRNSTKAVGNQAAIDALLMTNVAERWLSEKFWPRIFDFAHSKATEHRVPNQKPYTALMGSSGWQEHQTDRAALRNLTWGGGGQTEANKDVLRDVRSDVHKDAHKDAQNMVMPGPTKNQTNKIKPIPSWPEAMREEKSRAEMTLWLHDVLAIPTDYSDSHPALFDRVKALGGDPHHPALPSLMDGTAAQALLGAFEKVLADEFNQKWQIDAADYWERLHQGSGDETTQRYHSLLRKQATQAMSATDWVVFAHTQRDLDKPLDDVLQSLDKAKSVDINEPRIYDLYARIAVEANDFSIAKIHFEKARTLAIQLKNKPPMQPDELSEATEKYSIVGSDTSDDHLNYHSTYHYRMAHIGLLTHDIELTKHHFAEHDKAMRQEIIEYRTRFELDETTEYTAHGLSEYALKELSEELEEIQAHAKLIVIAKKEIRSTLKMQTNAQDKAPIVIAVLAKPSLANWLGFGGGKHYLASRSFLHNARLSTPSGYIHHCVEHDNDAIFQQIKTAGMSLIDKNINQNR